MDNIKKLQGDHTKRLGHAKSKLPTPRGEREPVSGPTYQEPEDLDRFRAEFYAHRE